MTISEDKRKALKEAGYTISDSGLTVMKDGKSIGGINTNGNIWSGSRKVASILKGESKPEEKPKSKPKAKSTPKVKSTSSAPSESKRPMRRTGKLNDDAKASRNSVSDTRVESGGTGGPRRQSNKSTKSEATTSSGTTLLRSDKKPSMREFINEKRRSNPDAFRADPSGFTERMREMYRENFGFNKGGMVRKGSKDYKKSGMFYKSASPRGYK